MDCFVSQCYYYLVGVVVVVVVVVVKLIHLQHYSIVVVRHVVGLKGEGCPPGLFCLVEMRCRNLHWRGICTNAVHML